MNERRTKKFKDVIAKRQKNLTVILENVHDDHNIGAVMRTCEAVGIMEIYVLYTEPKLQAKKKLYLGKRTTKGSRRWLDVHFFHDAADCFELVKSKYDLILSTHLGESSKDLYDCDLTGSLALLFGNEADGLSEEALSYSDGNFIIPQIGMGESLNISVACAVTLYEAYRQRAKAGIYDAAQLDNSEQKALFDDYVDRGIVKFNQEWVFPYGTTAEDWEIEE